MSLSKEFSFSSKLEKTFVKELSNKLQEWTDKRWIIALSKESGLPTVKEQKKNLQEDLFRKESESSFSKKVKEIFSDAELLKVEKDSKND